MSGDETVVLIASIALALVGWGGWFSVLACANRLLGGGAIRALLGIAPPVCVAILWVLLRCWAASDVRDSTTYLAMYTALGAAWIMLATAALGCLGISARDDAVERRNVSAACAVAGGLLGATFSFAGANFGSGPGWWVVVFSALLSTGGLLLVWLLIQAASDAFETITVERDVAAGVRVGCALAAAGIILGRSAAGDWQSAGQTALDFVELAWPVLGLVAVEIALAWLLRPAPDRVRAPLVMAGLLPGVAYLACAAWYVAARGWW